MKRRVLPALLGAAVLTATLAPAGAQSPAPAGDAVVVAVIDDAVNPYHWDFLGARMPQALDTDPGNDLPLDTSPHEWLPGFPDPSQFATYEQLELTLEDGNADRMVESLYRRDRARWNAVKASSTGAVRYYWVPGTKFVGLLGFGGSGVHGSLNAHGSRTASVSAGNLHGTCPECLLVFLSYEGRSDAEAAIEWAMAQPWIDVITNSYGFSLVNRDRLYSRSDVEAQRAASERGQTIFFSAGNGQGNDFRVPNSTYFSSQEGPDWIITVGGTSPQGGNYTGTGKPADVAAIALDYPSLGGRTVSDTGTFGGTSNATPVTAGIYGRALWWARERLDGPSRVQEGGVVARGTPVACDAMRLGCELQDGTLTARELRTRLLQAAIHTGQGLEFGKGEAGPLPPLPETEYLAEGHGTFWARMRADEQWAQEQARVTAPLDGTGPLTPRPEGEAEWFLVDSYCRQEIWLPWRDGDYRAGETPLPLPSPLWPLRSALAATCAGMFPPVAGAGHLESDRDGG